MNGSGCINCPVKRCDTITYRGSRCASLRARKGLGDPLTHAERIRLMTDDELAALITGNDPRSTRRFVRIESALKWLLQPVEEVEA